jgi:DNA ligase (NAD+)
MADSTTTSHSLLGILSTLEAADVAYYDLSAPTMSDADYDVLTRYYQAKTGIAWRRQGSLGDIPHAGRIMGTQAKVYSVDELCKELSVGTRCLQTPKIDGAGCELVYDAQGELVRALSRGKRVGGISYGDDITSAVSQTDNVPGVLTYRQSIDHPMVVRGELYMPKAWLSDANKLRIADGEKPFDNTRNCIAGILKKGDPRYLELLRFVAYKAFNPGVPQHEGHTFVTEQNMFEWLHLAGFETPPTRLMYNSSVDADELVSWLESEGLPYDTDGVVITLNEWAAQRSLGESSEYPRYSRAYKFADVTVLTKLVSIRWEASRTGRLAPTYIFEPVPLEGAMISQATGHNVKNVEALDAVQGDVIEIFRAGLIIPQVKRRLPRDFDPATTLADHLPTACPSCEGPVSRNLVDLLCLSDSCQAKLSKAIENLCNKKNLDVDGVGASVCEAICDAGLVSNLVEFLRLGIGPHDLTRLAELQLGDKGVTFGLKRAQSLLTGLQQAKSKPFPVVLHALGVPGLGEPECQAIAAKYSFDYLLDGSGFTDGRLASELTALKGVGLKTAESLVNWLQANKSWLPHMWGTGLNLAATGVADVPADGPLSGLTFVVTGVHAVPRPVLETYITQHGGTVSSAVSKKTSYLLAGEAAGSKLEKATKLAVPVIDESGLRALVEGV